MIRRIALAAVLALASGAAFAQAPTAFPNGFNNLPSTHWMASRDALAIPYDARWHVWFDDFTKYTAGDWVITTTEDGGNSATEALGDANGGTLVLTNDIGDNDLDFLQTVGELFTFASGKEMYFEARFKVVEATQNEFIIGLQVRDTTALAVSDGVFFQNDDGDTALDFHSMASSVDSAATAIHTMVDNTYITVAFYYDGGTTILAAVDDVVVATLSAVTPATTELTVSFGHQTGEATNVKVMTLDYILVAREK